MTLTLGLNDVVTVAGTPTLTLNDGGTATYTGGTGTNALTFSYTVGAGDNTASLAATAVNLNGATVQDGLGEAAILSLNGLTQTGPRIDATIPSVSSVATSGAGITAGTGDLVIGSVVTLTVNFSEAVTVADGTPTLTLSDGGTATYTGGSGSNALTFSYTVGAGQNTADLTVTAFNPGTATITNGAGTAANVTGAVTNPAGVLQINTTADITQVGNDYFLSNVSGTGPELKLGGAPVVTGQFGAWVPFGAVQTSTGYDVAWEDPGTHQYNVWSTNSQGNFISQTGVVPGNSTVLESLETTFHQDLNGDGVIGVVTTPIQTDGSTSLVEVGNNYDLGSTSSGSDPVLKVGGARVYAGEFGAWVPFGAVQTATGYDVAWEDPGTNQYNVWSTDSQGNLISQTGVVPGNSTVLEALEPIFNQNLNGDGKLTTTVIQTDTSSFGTTKLTEVADQVSSAYYLDGSSGSGPMLKLGGAPVVTGQFGAWVPFGAVQTSTGYDVAWEDPGTHQYNVWSTNSQGNFISQTGVVPGNSTVLEALETTFNQDLNGDGVIGLYAAPNTDLLISNPLAGTSGSATIGTSATLELAAANSASITFGSSTGMLKLDSPSTFSGTIFNFTGNGTLSGSDQIDLKGINFNSVHDTYANGVLTVTDGTHTDTLDFNGSYTLANFKFASDGSGGTIVYDPPVPAGQSENAPAKNLTNDQVVSALNQQLALWSQHMASAFPTSAFGNEGPSTGGLSELAGGQQAPLAQPVANQHHA